MSVTCPSCRSTAVPEGINGNPQHYASALVYQLGHKTSYSLPIPHHTFTKSGPKPVGSVFKCFHSPPVRVVSKHSFSTSPLTCFCVRACLLGQTCEIAPAGRSLFGWPALSNGETAMGSCPFPPVTRRYPLAIPNNRQFQNLKEQKQSGWGFHPHGRSD